MRIAIVTENFLPKVDGVTRTLARLLEYLQAHHHQVILLGPESGLDTYAGAQLYGTSGLPFPPYPELKLNFWRSEFTKQLIRFQPHVIHLVDPVFLCAAALFSILKLNKSKLSHIPIVASYHTNLASYCIQFGYGSWIANLMWRWNRFCHSHCCYTVCPSNSTKQALEKNGFKNLRLWYRGIDTDLFTPTKRSNALRYQWICSSQQQQQQPHQQLQNLCDIKEDPIEDKVIILYVGRVSYEKNLGLLLNSYKGMDHRRCHLIIVGDGPALKNMKRECHQQNIPVTYTGYLHGLELAVAYASADIFAFPSFTETFGQVILESMASGLPVVGLLAEGVRDLVTDQETGLLLDASSKPTTYGSSSLSHSGNTVRQTLIQGYRHLLTTLVENATLRSILGKKAVEKAKTYTWSNAMEMMVQTYRNAICTSKIERAATKGDEGNESGRVTRIIIERDMDHKNEEIQQIETVCEANIFSRC